LGSLAIITGKDISLEQHLPDWLEEGAESSLRDSEDDASQAALAYTHGIVPRAISSSSNMSSPVVLTPTGSNSPGASTPSGVSKSKWTDLDKFYADEEEEDVDDQEEEEISEEEEEESEEEEEVDEGEDDEDDTESDEHPATATP
jgi:AP-3 complex subunit beta